MIVSTSYEPLTPPSHRPMFGLHWNGPLNAPDIFLVGFPHMKDFAEQRMLLNAYELVREHGAEAVEMHQSITNPAEAETV